MPSVRDWKSKVPVDPEPESPIPDEVFAAAKPRRRDPEPEVLPEGSPEDWRKVAEDARQRRLAEQPERRPARLAIEVPVVDLPEDFETAVRALETTLAEIVDKVTLARAQCQALRKRAETDHAKLAQVEAILKGL